GVVIVFTNLMFCGFFLESFLGEILNSSFCVSSPALATLAMPNARAPVNTRARTFFITPPRESIRFASPGGVCDAPAILAPTHLHPVVTGEPIDINRPALECCGAGSGTRRARAAAYGFGR